MHGREKIRAWIKPIMEEYCELYTAYEWHTIDEEAGRAIVYMQNRRDHPSGTGTIDFPGITILEYGGDGLWKAEEDYWAVPASRRALKAYAEARQEARPGPQAEADCATTGATARPGRAARRPGSSAPGRSARAAAAARS